MKFELLEVSAPKYAPAGDRGYRIRVAMTRDYMSNGERVTMTTEHGGWVRTGDDSSAWGGSDMSRDILVSIACGAWVTVATLEAGAEFSEQWVWQSAAAVVSREAVFA